MSLIVPSSYPPMGTLSAADFQNLVASDLQVFRKNAYGAVPPVFTLGDIPSTVAKGRYMLRLEDGQVTLYPPKSFLLNDRMDGVTFATSLRSPLVPQPQELGLAEANMTVFEGGTFQISYASAEVDSIFFFTVDTAWELMRP